MPENNCQPHLVIYGCEMLALKNGRARVDLNQEIHITGNRITKVQSAPTCFNQDAYPSARVIDGRGLLAIPGLINTHAHVPMVLFRGLAEDVTIESWFNDYVFPLESNLTPDDVYWGAMLGIAEMIENGVTYVADHYFYMHEVARAVQESGIRANLVWAIFGHEGERKLDETSQFVSDWQGKADGRITTWLGPHAPYTTSPDFLRMCSDRAKHLDVGIHIHVSETARQVEMSLEEFGVTPVRMLADTGILDSPCILAHCAFPTEEDLLILKDAPAGVAHAPKTYLKMGSGVVDLARFLKWDIPVGMATDGATSNNTLDILEQMRMASLAQKHQKGDSTVFILDELMDITFRGAARVMRRADDLGAIVPGKLADITLIRQDGIHNIPRYNPVANLVYSAKSSDVNSVICDGKLLMHDRQLLTLDKALIKKEVAQRLERLSTRTHGKKIATYPV
ncbi:MAG: amidohydrolase [Chloroflexi bacterium]|nr:amidohydrolase [Chloroflexota bacterium]